MSVIAGFVVPHPPLIVPQVGRGGEKQIEVTSAAYEKVADEIAALKPDTIVISSPHAPMYADYFCISSGQGGRGSLASFGAPQVGFDCPYDVEFVRRLDEEAQKEGFPAGTQGRSSTQLDHGVMVPLFFINRAYRDFALVRIGLSGLDYEAHYELGRMISRVSGELDRRTVYVASGDLSHKLQSYGPYGISEEGVLYEKRIMQVLSSGDLKSLFDFDEDFCEKAAECGHRSFIMMAGAFDKRKLRSRVLSHQDVTGVGYGVCTFYPDEEV